MVESRSEPEARPAEPDRPVVGGYRVRVSRAAEDPDWDAFLAATPGGHHVQGTGWARIKAQAGFRPARVVVSCDDRIVAGATLLVRPLRRLGAIGYVPRGPLIAADDPALPGLVMDQLHRVAREHRVRLLAVQPPTNGQALAARLPGWGFRRGTVDLAPSGTIVIDLTQEPDEILAGMKSDTRKNVRRGQRRGVTVRQGTEDDLPTFHRLLVATGQRLGFPPEPEAVFRTWWRAWHPQGHLELFLAEYEGEAVSAQLLVPFGDTVVCKRIGWSGQHGTLYPNEALYWAFILWAKEQGYCHLDLEEIDPAGAEAILRGDPLPSSLAGSSTSFKLGFGGRVILYPGTYVYVYNPLLRWTYNMVFPRVMGLSLWGKVLRLLRRR